MQKLNSNIKNKKSKLWNRFAGFFKQHRLADSLILHFAL